MRQKLRRIEIALIPMWLALAALPARADIISISQGRNIEYNQTGPSTVGLFGAFFSGSAFFPAVGDYDTGTLTYPGPGSPQALFPGTFGGPNVGFQTPFLADQTAMDAAYPFGTYTYQAVNTGTSATSSSVGLSYTVDAYTADIPLLTAASFSALQGLMVGQSLVLNFNAFTPDPGADFAATFLTITDASTSSVVYQQPFLNPSTTSVSIPAGTFAPNTHYTYELIFDGRINGTDSTLLGIPTQLLFDRRTFGDFTTAPVPEPTTAITLGLGCLALVVRRITRRPAA